MSSASAYSAPTVVIVEDDVALLQALRFMLISEGFETEACESAEALLALDLPALDVCLVIDERLPGLQGLAALEELRGRGVDAPAIVITTNPEDSLRETALRWGAEIVEKPLVGDVLLARIRALVNGKEP